jgi:hypothetical protein
VHVCGVLSQPDDELVSLLQNLADMDVTYKALQVKLLFFFFICPSVPSLFVMCLSRGVGWISLVT